MGRRGIIRHGLLAQNGDRVLPCGRPLSCGQSVALDVVASSLLNQLFLRFFESLSHNGGPGGSDGVCFG